jgi:hypothetical protein
MPALLELQRAVYRGLVAREDGAAATHIRGDGLAAAARLNIYRNTLFGSLTNALRLSYPAVHRLVGADYFEAAAQTFIEGEFPRSAYLDTYGAGFPDFLARLPHAASVPYLADVAHVEWAVSRALHAPDVEPLDLRLLAELPPVDRGRVRFVPHPSVSLIRSSYPADTIWRAVLAQDDAALAGTDFTDAPLWLLIERLSTGVDVKRLTELAWRYTAELCAGQTLQAAIEAVAQIDASTQLAEHLAAGRFVAFSIAKPVAVAQPSENAR